jgi:uncharacterized protein YpmB
MQRFISSVLFTFTILTGAASFAQSPLPVKINKAVPARTASDTVDVQHVIDAYHEAVLTHVVNGKEQNRGSETWVLVKGTEGWRIAAITYSSNPHVS